MNRRMLVCYVPGLDRRSITAVDAPAVHRLMQSYSMARLQTLPTTELFPSLVTGVSASDHQIWNVSLRPDADAQPRRWYDRLPDALTATAQCVRHVVDRAFELPAVPPRRRRRFDLHRLKFDLRLTDPQMVRTIGGYTSLFGQLGDASRYLVIKRFGDLDRYAQMLPDPKLRFDMIEFHAYDLASHWNIDRPGVMRGYLQQLDAFIGDLQARCAKAGVLFVLLVDHGQEAVVGTINLPRLLRETGVPQDEYDYFLAVVVGRFWFHSDRARQRITAMLRDADHVNLLTNDQMRQFGVDFDAQRFGELYAVTDQGWLFFPHDFHHPLGSMFMGLKNPLMRRRVWDGRHRGYHGHLPGHPAEDGYVVVADPAYAAVDETMRLVDFAPTVLAMMGETPLPHMAGRVIFECRFDRARAAGSAAVA